MQENDEYIAYGGFVDIGDIDLQPVPEKNSCFECKWEGDCEIYYSLREDARTMYKPCKWFGRDAWEPKEKTAQ